MANFNNGIDDEKDLKKVNDGEDKKNINDDEDKKNINDDENKKNINDIEDENDNYEDENDFNNDEYYNETYDYSVQNKYDSPALRRSVDLIKNDLKTDIDTLRKLIIEPKKSTHAKEYVCESIIENLEILKERIEEIMNSLK